jgi:hypothetical protein
MANEFGFGDYPIGDDIGSEVIPELTNTSPVYTDNIYGVPLTAEELALLTAQTNAENDLGGVPGLSTTAQPVVVGANNDITKYLNSILGTKLTDKQVTAMGIGAGGVAGLMGAMTSTRNPVGYQGSVDMSRQAVRQQVPQSTAPREYGAPAMGRRYFTDTQYTNPAGLAAAQANAAQQAQAIAAQQAPVQAAQGGLMYAAKGRYLRGETDGMADRIRTSIDGTQPAALSHGEFIIPADVVSHLGNGNSDAGAKKLKDMMSRVRKARTGTTKQGKEINPNKFMPGGLAQSSYATGGEVQKFAGGSEVTGAAITAGLTGTESNLSNFAGPYVTNMLSQGQALANAPYQAYGGQLTAGTSPLQQQAFNQASSLEVPSAIGQAATTAGNIANTAQGMAYNPATFGSQFNAPGAYQNTAFNTGTFGTDQAQQYMNPYLKSALDPQIAELQRQGQIQNLQNQAKATSMGAFGGSGSRLMQTETQRNTLDKIQQALGQGYGNAFDRAQAAFNADQARNLQAQQAAEQSKQFGASQGMTAAQLAAQYGLSGQQATEASRQFGANYGLQGLNTALQGAQTQGQLGTAQNQAALSNLNALSGLGQTQRGIESEAVAADRAQFEEERANPYKMVQFQQSLLQGLPLAAQNYNVAQPSLYQQLAGGTSGLATLLGNLGYTLPGSTAAK